MRRLQVMEVEDDWLVVVSDTGERFHIALDDALKNLVRGTTRPTSSSQRVSPKDIQAHIRRGLSAQEVADLTGETVDYIALFEGPVVAEREYVAQQAQSIHFAQASDRDEESSFGFWVRSRLEHLGATNAAWSAWKEESGWRVEVSFLDGQVEHKARWSFDPRKQILIPLNDDATVLSQSEPIQGPLIPRLRPVVATDESPAGERFDSEIFDDMPLADTGPLTEPVAYGKTTSVTPEPPESASPSNETADLLEALRRRRGEREPAPDAEDLAKSHHPSTGSIRLVSADDEAPAESEHRASVHAFPGTGEVPRPDDDDNTDAERPQKPGSKKGRTEMPSWDDIVFGTKPDDDPA